MKFILVAIILIMATESVLAAECGTVSWYDSNGITASGEKMNSKKRTAAHKRLPFGSMVKITDKRTGKSSVAKITDRGPFIRGRILDVSKQVAKDLGILSRGTSKVCYQIL